MEVKYYLNDINIKDTYGIRVADSKGVLDHPGWKDPVKGEWPDQHGHIIDLNARTLEARKITLDCSMVADDALTLGTNMAAFMQFIDGVSLVYMRISIDDPESKPLFYMVYLDGPIQVKKRWRAGTVGAFFTLTFIEPEPLKKVLLYDRTESSGTCTLTITSTDPLNVYWGTAEGASYAVRGTGAEVSHSFDQVGQYYIIITGKIDGATVTLPANTTTVWSRL